MPMHKHISTTDTPRVSTDEKKSVIGAIVSTAGGKEEALLRAREWGFDCIQIGASKQWDLPPPDRQSVDSFFRARQGSGVQEVVAHAMAFVDLASPDKEKARKSVKRLVCEIENAMAFKFKSIVLHPGWTAGRPIEEAMDRVVRGLNDVLDRTAEADVQLLLETMAGTKHMVGSRFEDLRYITERVSRPDRIGVCLDTCHMFGAGYDIRGFEGFTRVLKEFDEVVGIPQIKALHLNDSRDGLGSGRDRHVTIGEGCLGLETFRAVLQQEELLGLPMIVENRTEQKTIPRKDIEALRRKDVETLRTLVDGSGLRRRHEAADGTRLRITGGRGARGAARLADDKSVGHEVLEFTPVHALADPALLPGEKGAYILEFDLGEAISIHALSLGRVALAAGRYRYYGSAYNSGGLRARVNRHLRTNGRRTRFMVDALSRRVPVARIMAVPGAHECDLVAADLRSGDWAIAIERFGSTDCKRGCGAHLLKATPAA